MRFVGLAMLAMMLGSSATLAAGNDTVLAAGKPAGVHKAQGSGINPAIYVTGLAALGIGVGLAVSDNDVKTVAATATGGTTP